MSEPPISRGFRGRRRPENQLGRVPPGQHVVTDFPVLSAGPTPDTDLESWSFALFDAEAHLAEWSWANFEALPQTKVKVDIHCVTTWSKLDTNWQGVTIDALLEAAGLSEPPAPFAMIRCDGGYTTNLPVEDPLDGKAMIATRMKASLSLPSTAVRLGCSFLTSISGRAPSWVRRLQFIDHDQPGFWEELGYHMYGDPWREQRYAGD